MGGRLVKRDAQDAAPRDLGRYRLHGELASGGMATVHFGRQVGGGGFAKTVAIKRLHPQFAKLPEFVSMFLAEARLAARIRHPNVVQPLDVLQLEDEIFLVMEYIDGDSLSRLMKGTVARKERLPTHLCITIMCGVLHGLHAAHEARNDRGEPLGIVHRDVSPQNILVGVDGIARVIDFGIAKAADSVQITREGEVKGKLSYMSPEQLNNGPVTRQIDIYAASVVLWEILTGQRLFDADYQSAILKNILHRPIEPPSEIAPDVPREVDEIVLRGLAKDPKERWATARAMALALEERVVPATATQVGAWVERVAAVALENRAARIAEIEAVPSDGVEEEVRSEMIIVERGSQFVQDLRTDPTRAWKRTGNEPAPPSRRTPTAGANASGPHSKPIECDDGRPVLPPPTIVVPQGPTVAPEWPVPGIPIAPPESVSGPEAARKSASGGGGTVILLLVIAAAVAGFYFYLPELIKRGYVSSAAREGVTLAIDRVEVSTRAIRLSGVTASAAEVPGVMFRAQSIDLGLYRIDPVTMTMHGVLLTVDGSYPVIHDAMAVFFGAHPLDEGRGTVRTVDIESAHVIWNRPFGESTKAEAENISLSGQREPPHALGEDFDLEVPLLSLTTAGGKLGPWKVKWHREGPTSRVTVGFDPLGPSGAQAKVMIYEGAVQTVDATVPRVPLAQVGITPALFGHKADDPVTAEAVVSYRLSNPAHAEANASLVISGAKVSGASSSADASLEAHVAGDPTQPLDIHDSALAFGPYRGKLTGSLAIAATYLKADLAWKSAAQRCSAGDQVVTLGLKFDSRQVDDSALAVAPNVKCGSKLFGP